MKETGIVRRIDELGRVVIPKEIRKTLRLNEGDPIEIYTEREELVLKKFSPISASFGFAKNMVESIYAQTGHPALVCDTDIVLAVKGQGLSGMEKQSISDGLLTVLKEKREMVSEKIGIRKFQIVSGIDCEYQSRLILPVLSQGDLIGGVIVLSKEEIIDSKTISVASFCADFMGRAV